MLLTSFLLMSAAFVAASPHPLNGTQEACTILSKLYPDSTFFPGSSRYDFENTYPWSAEAWLGPACAFCPYKPEMVSIAVQLFSANQILFSIRGGGAMPVKDAANIGPEGILISSTNMTFLEISDDRQVLSVGSGIRWPEVYSYLDPYDVIVNGIRIGDVGVVGFVLGGGIGFFSYEHGLAATGIKEFECVLASGEVITANQIENSDLFWALRGGGNSFCIVTRIDLYTIDSSLVYLGNIGYGSGTEVKNQYIQSMVDFSLYASDDPRSALEGQIRWNPAQSNDITYWAFLFHNGEDYPAPGLQNLTAPVLPFASGNVTQQTMKIWSDSFPYSTDLGFRNRFHFISIPADPEAFRIAHDTYFANVEGLASVNEFFTAFSLMPITDHVIAVSGVNGGNPLGLSEESVPALWLVESPAWKDAADDVTVTAAHDKANAEIAVNLAAAGFNELPFVYLSDAEKGQSVFPTYGQANLQRLKAIRDKYDPGMVYTNLMPGGDKVANA